MKTRVAVLSLLLEITLCHQFEIMQRRSMPSCALYSFQERQFGFHVRPLVDKNRPGLCKVYVRKRDLVENEQINLYGWQRPRGFVEQYWSRLENANAPDSLHKEVSSIVLGQNNSVDNIY